MPSTRTVLIRWGLALTYLALVFLLILVVPYWARVPLLLVYVGLVTWRYLTQERSFGRYSELRPLTPWDIAGYREFRDRLGQACSDLGMTREPHWAVEDDEVPNAYCIGGRRGVVVFTKGLLRLHPPEEVLAIAGHELKHLASKDHLPALLGGSWLGLLGWIAAQCDHVAENSPGLFAALLKLVALVLDLLLWASAWLAEAILAKRSRFEEHMADVAGARVTSAAAMGAALQRLAEYNKERRRDHNYPKWSTAWITSRLHASHPPMAERIRFLQEAAERGEIHA